MKGKYQKNKGVELISDFNYAELGTTILKGLQSQQVEDGFIPRPNIKKIIPAKLLTSGPSMVPRQCKKSQKSGC